MLRMLTKGSNTQGQRDHGLLGSRTRAGSIKVDYQTELQRLVLSVFIQVQGVVMIRMI